MENKKALELLKSMHRRDFLCSECQKDDDQCKSSCEYGKALVHAIKALEKNNEILEYLKISLSQSDKLKEKHRNVDDDGLKENHKRMAIIFEGMGEAYDDLLNRFFKEDSENGK